MNSWSSYKDNYNSGSKDKLGTTSGVLLSGGALYNSLAAGNKDAVENEADTLDVCLAHPTPQSAFHYHYWSGCAVKNYGFWSSTDAPSLCKNKSGCTTAPGTMSKGAGTNGVSSQTSYFTAANWDKPIGIARDGHLIVGPYKDSSGTTWSCTNRDVCNGAWQGSQYVYVGSETFPYTIGCWGPGPTPVHKPCCTNSGCGTSSTCTARASYELGLLGVGVAVAALSLF